jgi:hypothetical protein
MSIREALSGHGDYRDCPGAECTVCKTARDHMDWPRDIPYIVPSRLRVKDRDATMAHYKNIKRAAWKEAQGGDASPAEPLPELKLGLDSSWEVLLNKAKEYLNRVGIEVNDGSLGQGMVINQDPGTHTSEVLVQDGNDLKNSIPGTQNQCETIVTTVQNPSESRDIHTPEELQPSDANVSVEPSIAVKRGRGRPPKRKRGRASRY